MLSSFLFSSLSYVSLFSLLSYSFLSMTSSLLSSLTLITQFIIEEMKNAVSFDMSFLSHSFCQYDSLCMFCAIWLIVARIYFHQLLNFQESENWMIHISYETHKLFMYQFLHLLTTFLDCWVEYWWEWLSEKVLFFLDWSSSWVSSWHFEFDSIRSRVAHIFNLTRLDSTENWVNSTQLVKNSSLTSRELNIEIFSVFCFCIIFLHYLFDRSHDEKHEDYMIENHEEESW